MALESTIGPGGVAEDIACPSCGYDLRGIASDKCPECGFAVDREKMSASRIPWEHTGEIGIWRAYWRTNLTVILRPRLMAEEMNRLVDFRRARTFRLVTVALAWVPLAGWVLVLYSQSFRWIWPRLSFEVIGHMGWLLEFACVLVGLVAIWLFLEAVGGSASYFFHPRTIPVALQNRAIAISYYGCAAMAWMWLPATTLALGLTVKSHSTQFGDVAERIGFDAVVGAIVFGAILLIALWSRNILLLESCFGRSPVRTLIFAVYLPISWGFLFGLCWLLVGAAVFISLFILSLR